MKKLITTLSILALFAACSIQPRTHQCVKEVVSFVENQKDCCAFYTEDEWNKANREYIELLKEANQYNYDLSQYEKVLIAKATTTYVLLQRHRNIENLKNSLEPQ